MNKKSNIIVGSMVVVVVLMAVLGVSIFSGPKKSVVPKVQEVQAEQVMVAEQQGSKVSEVASSGSFVASKQGKKYFPVDCGSAKTIKEENKVYFSSASEAEQAGYERTATCK